VALHRIQTLAAGSIRVWESFGVVRCFFNATEALSHQKSVDGYAQARVMIKATPISAEYAPFFENPVSSMIQWHVSLFFIGSGTTCDATAANSVVSLQYASATK
jgi:hypothetical protein